MAESASGGELPSVRVGHVSSYDPTTHTARIKFEDKEELVSYPFQVVLPNTLKNHDEYHLDIGEHVLCVCLGNGIEAGYVLGALYSQTTPPPVGNIDRRVTIFEDEAHLMCDRKKHIMQIKDHYGSYIMFADGDIIIQSARHIHLNPGDLPAEELGGHLAAQFD